MTALEGASLGACSIAGIASYCALKAPAHSEARVVFAIYAAICLSAAAVFLGIGWAVTP